MLKVRRVLKVLLVHKVQLVFKELQDYLVFKVHKDPQV